MSGRRPPWAVPHEGRESRLPKDFETGRHFTAGAIGGICGSFLSYPFEMLRAARMHNRSFMDEMVKQ